MLLEHEGGFVNHPDDPGGMTNLGVTRAVYEEYMGRTSSEEEMRELTHEDVAAIYKENYWDRIKGDSLPSGVDWSVFDWCSTGAGLAAMQGLNPQIIKVLDTLGPVISNFPDTLFYTSDNYACSADVQLPAITITDACSPADASFRIIGPSSTIYNQAGVMRNVPFGTHEFTYIAEDGCGNQSQRIISLTIKDRTAPTAIARQLSVSLIK